MNVNEVQLAEMKKRALAIREKYAAANNRQYANILILGDPGTGKTTTAITAPKPVHMDIFDPGGAKTKALQPYIKKGDIIPDAVYSDDTWKNPHALRDWEKTFLERKRSGYFDYIGTYYLDSATKWTDSILFEIMKKAGRPGAPTQIQDYNVQQLTAIDYIGMFADLPCHVVVTGHFGFWKDDVTGAIEAGMLVAGKLSDKIPLCFDEKYVSRVLMKGGKEEYVLQMHTKDRYKAETRIGGDSFETFEKPDLRELFKRAGLSYEDKAPLY